MTDFPTWSEISTIHQILVVLAVFSLTVLPLTAYWTFDWRTVPTWPKRRRHAARWAGVLGLATAASSVMVLQSDWLPIASPAHPVAAAVQPDPLMKVAEAMPWITFDWIDPVFGPILAILLAPIGFALMFRWLNRLVREFESEGTMGD